ncbi:LOW QUALITY PROTEIN: reverse transcriptase [Phytophthora megakarya]|uniref:Reverse transcriptase n=1 Tax=Phytophthora megakarya TaxID=4795 RepID=A0A225V0R2_9STRA|nr:LOW QUALITY PROTEIN: reverse transcriptase [Phytophthora megakarya]
MIPEFLFEPSIPLYGMKYRTWIPKTSVWLKEFAELDAREPWRNYWLDCPAKHPYNTTFYPCNPDRPLFVSVDHSLASVGPLIVRDPALTNAEIVGGWEQTFQGSHPVVKALVAYDPVPEALVEPADPPDGEDPVPTSREEDDEVSEEEESEQEEIKEPPPVIEDEDEDSSTQIIASADYISKRVIQDQSSLEVTDPGERKLLQGLNRIHGQLMKDPSPREQSLVSKQSKATEESVPEPTSRGPKAGKTNRQPPSPRNPDRQDSEEDLEDVHRERWRRICSHQAHDPGLIPLVRFLRGETEQLTLRQATHLAKIADQFVLDLDSRVALFYVSRNTTERLRDAADRLRLVVPQDLQGDILHHCHADFQGAHQGIIWTYERRARSSTGSAWDTEQYVKECVGCVTAKGLPRNPGPSPGILLDTRPFQCVFSGFIMCKAMASTEAYEECVFRRFGASEMIRHD